MVIPVAKALSKTGSKLFSRISFTSTVCKVLGILMKEKMLAHFFGFSFLTLRRYGFLLRWATLVNLAIEEWATKYFNKGSTADLIYQGFPKAFDLTNHCLLLGEFRGYSDTPICHKLDRIFLLSLDLPSELQRCSISNGWSVHGVFQCSAIGPMLSILFIIYVKCLSYILVAECLLYADDVRLIAPGNH